MTSYYLYNANRDQHNVELARTFSANRAWMAEQAGDLECARRWSERVEKILDADPGYSSYPQRVYGEAGAYLRTVIEWAKMHRAACCEGEWYAQYAS